MPDRYSCFLCADIGKDIDRKLEDHCSICNRPYGFPLEHHPDYIAGYKILKSLDRGYYSATFKAEDPKFVGKIVALKVIPKEVYNIHGKNFVSECNKHNEVASGSQMIVQIENYFEEKVLFDKCEIDCYIEVLQFVNGISLEKIIKGVEAISAVECTQVAKDLFTVLYELKEGDYRHNDLHGGNVIVERLASGQYRLNEIDPKIRIKIIDLNSAHDSEGPYLDDRLRDVQRVANLIKNLVKPLLGGPSAVDDLSNRALSKLFDVANFMDTAYPDERHIEYADIVEIIRTEFDESQSNSGAPWKKDLRLKRINEFYNAQAIDLWFASHLFVDPHDEWLPSVSAKGPQLITGMRGCGKTILLKSLQFHARANHPDDRDSTDKINRIINDGYVGLYVSSSRLTDIGSSGDFGDAVSILFLGFIKSALEAVRHIQDLDDTLPASSYHDKFVRLLTEIIPSSSSILSHVIDATSLNFQIEKMQYSLYRGEKTFRLEIEPAAVFRSLAKTVRKTCGLWNNHHVLFLLDDVSTRYVNNKRIAKLISQLLVQNDIYSFKFTSEIHTIRYLLNSPGNIEVARPGRDYDVLDLGSLVRERIHGARSKGRKKFVQDILLKRFSYLNQGRLDVDLLPKQLLGDVPLVSIAQSIGRVSQKKSRSSERKSIYYGFSVLIGMCVGDIGDILNIYEKFIQLSEKGKSLKKAIQSQVYFEFCSLRLADLKRLEADMEAYAMGFARAANKRLVESFDDSTTSKRLRQYNSIYVRITADDKETQEKMLIRINDMIDSGIFVSPGFAVHSKTGAANPLLQFVLVFRKIYGLTHLIGLAERDRFELSGDALQEWLANPERCEEMLMSSPTSEDPLGPDPDDDTDETPMTPEISKEKSKPDQPLLFEAVETSSELFESKLTKDFVERVLPATEVFNRIPESMAAAIQSLVIAFGFEKRADASLNRYIKKINPSAITGFRYLEQHTSKSIFDALETEFPTIQKRVLDYKKLGKDFRYGKGDPLVDISGMSKALIYNCIKKIVKVEKQINIVHTEAASYYPTDREMERVLDAFKDDYRSYEFLDTLNNLMGGEVGPYDHFNLADTESDEARNRVLFAFAKPKNERLYHLLDKREFDRIELITPNEDSSPRSKVAKIVAGIISGKYPNTEITTLEANDLTGTLQYLSERFHHYYVRMNANVEIALTGSKRQTLAAALLSNLCKFSKVWYVKPKDINENRFSKGVGKTTYIHVRMP